ncbi:MAG: NAD(P)/FAD-dependent oxidoreductase [Bacteroidetes bacterium]|nr:NAD(P)/FAD-dependent oxidoreductase [Bacteroidota bacterium]
MNPYDVIVIGGGAAGLLAAGRAAEQGATVLLLEKMNQPGRKLRITGKGRCNLTNIAPMREFMDHIGENARFLRPAFSTFFSSELIAFFENKGVPITVERGARAFPTSEQAQDIFNALIRWVEKLKVDIRKESSVTKILADNGIIEGVEVNNSQLFYASKVILATGGCSYPATGSTGDGYKLAKSLGHSVTKIRPALVPLETKGNTAQELQGLSLKNVKASIWIDGKKKGDAFGEMMFTHFGITGPIVLTLSRKFSQEIQARQPMICSIDLKPALDDNILDARLLRDLNEHGKMKFHSVLRKWLPGKLALIAADLLHISGEKLGNQISAEERRKIRLWLKDFRFEITGSRSFAEAIITAGGIDLNEVDSKTMESKLVKGLFFAGEVLDLDADTGGYNLQIAFSTAWLAGSVSS